MSVTYEHSFKTYNLDVESLDHANAAFGKTPAGAANTWPLAQLLGRTRLEDEVPKLLESFNEAVFRADEINGKVYHYIDLYCADAAPFEPADYAGGQIDGGDAPPDGWARFDDEEAIPMINHGRPFNGQPPPDDDTDWGREPPLLVDALLANNPVDPAPVVITLAGVADADALPVPPPQLQVRLPNNPTLENSHLKPDYEIPNLDTTHDVTHLFDKNTIGTKIKDAAKVWEDFSRCLPPSDTIGRPLPPHHYERVTPAKDTMQPVFPKLLSACVCAPTRDNYYEVPAAAVGRLYNVHKQNKATELNPRSVLTICARLFREYTGKGLPMTYEQLVDYQRDNPKFQKRVQAFEAQADSGIDLVQQLFSGTSAFQKLEPAVKPIESYCTRNITADSDTAVLLMSQYTKPLSMVCSKMIPGYAFGKSNASIATRIHDLASKYGTVFMTDFSAYDGTQNMATMTIEWSCYYAFFGDQSDDILGYKMQSINTIVQSEFMTYSTLASRHSGAADTSLCNTLNNIVLMVYARCVFEKDWSDENIDLAISKMMAGGDDGLMFDVSDDLAQFIEVFIAELGLTIKAVSTSTAQPITFLSRIYPNANLHAGSGCDIKRMLGKMVMGKLGKTPIVALAQNVGGRLLMDNDTPMVTDFLKGLARLLSPYVSKADLSCISPQDFAYSALLGQPPQCHHKDSEYLNANDPEAVAALSYAMNVVNECEDFAKLIFRPTPVPLPETSPYPKEVMDFVAIHKWDADLLHYFGLSDKLRAMTEIKFDDRIPEVMQKLLFTVPDKPLHKNDEGNKIHLVLPKSIEELIHMQRSADATVFMILPVSWQPMVNPKFRMQTYNPWYMLVALASDAHGRGNSFRIFNTVCSLTTNPYERQWDGDNTFSQRIDRAITNSLLNKDRALELNGKKNATTSKPRRKKEAITPASGGDAESQAKNKTRSAKGKCKVDGPTVKTGRPHAVDNNTAKHAKPKANKTPAGARVAKKSVK